MGSLWDAPGLNRPKEVSMDKKTIMWIGVFAAVLLLCAAAYFFLSGMETGPVAVITVDGEVYERIDLSKVKESYDIEIDTPFGHNTVHVVPGGISISEADCPDGVCVRQGLMTKGGIPIVCLPHRLIISMEGSGIDA